jgi:hypothetical protein
MSPVAAALLVALAAGCSTRSSVALTVDGDPAVTLDELALTATLDGTTTATRHTDPTPSLRLPQQLLLVLPDSTQQIAIDVVGMRQGVAVADGRTGTLTVAPHQTTSASVTLNASATVGDMAAVRDFAVAAPDLASSDLAGQPMVTLRSIATAYDYSSQNPTTLTINKPANTTNGDFLLATVAVGSSGSAQPPTISAPGWTLVDRHDKGGDTTLVIYYRVAGVLEPLNYAFACNQQCEGPGWIAAFTGVGSMMPIDAHNGLVDPSSMASYTGPSATTKQRNALVIATFASHAAAPSTWNLPNGTTTLVDFNNTDTRSIMSATQVAWMPGPIGPFTSTASKVQDYALMHILALAP